jgi:hypothetical protein
VTAPAPPMIGRCSPRSRPSPSGGLRPALPPTARRHKMAASRSEEGESAPQATLDQQEAINASHKSRCASNPGCSTGARGLFPDFCWVPHWAASVPAEVVSDLRRATSVQHHRRTEPSATNLANARSPQYQRTLAVTNTANDGWETFTRQGSLVRSQYRP